MNAAWKKFKQPRQGYLFPCVKLLSIEFYQTYQVGKLLLKSPVNTTVRLLHEYRAPKKNF